MSNPLLQIKNLSVDFVTEGKSTPALQNIDITVRRGEILAIVGESGSGKSVTALSVLQILPAPPAVYTSGEILLTTEETTINMLKATPSIVQSIRGNKVAMIFQEPMTSLNPVLSCGSQVMEAILLHKNISRQEARQKAIALFERVQLPDPPQCLTLTRIN